MDLDEPAVDGYSLPRREMVRPSPTRVLTEFQTSRHLLFDPEPLGCRDAFPRPQRRPPSVRSNVREEVGTQTGRTRTAVEAVFVTPRALALAGVSFMPSSGGAEPRGPIQRRQPPPAISRRSLIEAI